MGHTGTLVMVIFLTLHTNPGESTVIPDLSDVSEVIEECRQSLFDLALCLREETSLLNRIHLCKEQSANLFLCMANYSEDEDETLTAQVQPDDEEYIVKRGLGRCIHKCLQGRGRMNFIQCKSMCHK